MDTGLLRDHAADAWGGSALDDISRSEQRIFGLAIQHVGVNQMRRFVRSVVAGLIAAVCLWPVAISAQPAPDARFNVEAARTAFVGSGYQVDEAINWDWTSPAVSTFRVHDPADNRVLMVLVYPSDTAALLARQQAEAHDQALDGLTSSSGGGPHLLVGYGPSIWQGNVALVETTQSELARAYQADIYLENGVYVGDNSAWQAPQVGMRVDVDFLQALNNSVVDL